MAILNQTWTLPSPAKLNLFLHVLERRADGYHNLQTAFQFVDYCDQLHVTALETPEITLSGTQIEDNLILRAAHALRAFANIKLGAQIHLDKHIPIGGGLGGGSSNAATTLLALNALWGTQLTGPELITLGLKLGADVPIFLFGHAAWAEGVGEKLIPISPAEPWYLVVTPPCHVSTAKIFQDPQLTRRTSLCTIADLKHGRCTNDCQSVTEQHYPEVSEAIAWLNTHGSARMTGTGSSVFAELDSKAQADQVLAKLPPTWSGFVAKGSNVSPLHSKMQQCVDLIGASPSGKAQGFDPCIPRFESWRPSHLSSEFEITRL